MSHKMVKYINEKYNFLTIQLLLTDYEEGVIVTNYTRLNSSLLSTSLSVWLTSPHQSGNYHCIPTNTQKATVKLHVLTGTLGEPYF